MASPIISANDWGWRYAGRSEWALRGVTLAVDAGERVLLLGPSGAGKSTLLLALAGVLAADEGVERGQLLVNGRHPTRMVGQVGLVQQSPESQVVLSSVGDDVAFGCENLCVPRDEIWPRVDAALGAVGLEVPLDRPTDQLSGGEQQRLVLAGAVAMHGGLGAPGLLLLDEPTANLDPDGVAEVRAAIGRLAADRSVTLVIVEHRVGVWLDLIDRVIVLGSSGGVIADGPPARVFADRGDELAAQGVWVPGVALPVEPRETAPGSGEVILRGVDLTVGYSADQPVLSHVDVAIPRGVSTVITGPNGVGKSALALTLGGLLPQLAGEVVAGAGLGASPINRRQRKEARRRSEMPLPPTKPAENGVLGGRKWQVSQGVGLTDPHEWTSGQLLTRLGTVFQQPEHQFVTGSVRDELAVALREQGRTDVDARVGELLATLHLEALADANPFTLSGGEQRRLSVGTVLAAGPQVIILDEPTFGQDRVTWCDMVSLIMQLLDEGRTVISVTHDQDFVAVLGQNRVALPGNTPAPPLTPPRRDATYDQNSGEKRRTRGRESHLSAEERPATSGTLGRLNPLARFVFACVLAAPVLITLDWVSSATMLGLQVVIFWALGTRPREMARRLWPVTIVAVIAAASMALYARPDGQVLWHWWVMTISTHSLLLALAIFCRILALALAAVVLLGGVDPTLMADALAQLAHLPARFVLGTLAGVRLLGLMSADWRSLGLARRARGLGDRGAVRRFASMAFTLLVMAIRRGAKLATAMQVRGFGANPHRTWARRSNLTRADAVGLVATLLVAAASVAAAVWAGTFWFIWTGGLS